MQILFITGRIILGGYFIYSGYNHFKNLASMTGYAVMKKVPSAKAAVIVGGVMMVLGGLAIFLNVYPIIGMMLLVLFLIPTTIVMHQFWKESDPMVRMGERINFTKNLALIGALLLIISLG